MGKYRNITDEARFLATPHGLVKVEPDEVVDIDDVNTEPQPSLWAPVSTGSKKAASAAKEG